MPGLFMAPDKKKFVRDAAKEVGKGFIKEFVEEAAPKPTRPCYSQVCQLV